MKRVGPKGAGRFERIGWDEALDTIAARFGEIAASADGPQAIVPYSYAGHDGTPPIRIDGPPLLQPPRRVAARSDDLRDGRQGRLGRDDRRVDRHRRRALRREPSDPDLGQQSDRLQSPFLDPRAGSQAPRRKTDRDRSLSQPDSGEVPSAHRAHSGHGCRARARHDARADRRGSPRSRLHRAPHARLRCAARACRRVPAAPRRRHLRHRRGNRDRARPRVRDDETGGDPPELWAAAPCGRRQRGARDRLPAGAHRVVARSRGRGAAVDIRAPTPSIRARSSGRI